MSALAASNSETSLSLIKKFVDVVLRVGLNKLGASDNEVLCSGKWSPLDN